MRITLTGLIVLSIGLILQAQFPADAYLEKFATGIELPTEITHSNDDRTFVCEKKGKIRIIQADGTLLPEAFLDISARVSDFNEQGLLGLAFHPDYENNGWFFISYTDLDYNQQIARFSVSQNDPNRALSNSEKQILEIEEYFTLHLGGCLKFGPDGLLYISVGEAGFASPSQESDTFLGKILRIDIDNGDPYNIPSNNLFNGPNDKKEIWAMGLRNPWKFSFDNETGDVWISDVGERIYEEINLIKNDGSSKMNMGWPCFEGPGEAEFSCNNSTIDKSQLNYPISGYGHELWLSCSASITGGYIYRNIEEFGDKAYYFFGDYCTGRLYTTYEQNGEFITEEIYRNNAVLNDISTFGKNHLGEILVADLVQGAIFKLRFDCSLPDIDLTVASCNSSKDGCIELTTPANGGILDYELTDKLGAIIPEDEYCQLLTGEYLLGINNIDKQCSKEIPIQIEKFFPYFTKNRASCSARNDGSISISVNQEVSTELNYYVETISGELIDSSAYNNLFVGDYNILVSTDSEECIDTFDFLIFYYYDSHPIEYENGVLIGTDTYESYQWFYNEEPTYFSNYDTIFSATNNSYTPTMAGSYLLQANDVEGCKHWGRKTVQEITAIEKNTIFRDIKLYPNPVQDQLNIDLSSIELSESLFLQIFSLKGDMITNKIPVSPRGPNFQIPTKHLIPGSYLIEFSRGEDKSHHQFIKI